MFDRVFQRYSIIWGEEYLNGKESILKLLRLIHNCIYALLFYDMRDTFARHACYKSLAILVTTK